MKYYLLNIFYNLLVAEDKINEPTCACWCMNMYLSKGKLPYQHLLTFFMSIKVISIHVHDPILALVKVPPLENSQACPAFPVDELE